MQFNTAFLEALQKEVPFDAVYVYIPFVEQIPQFNKTTKIGFIEHSFENCIFNHFPTPVLHEAPEWRKSPGLKAKLLRKIGSRLGKWRNANRWGYHIRGGVIKSSAYSIPVKYWSYSDGNWRFYIKYAYDGMADALYISHMSLDRSGYLYAVR